MAVKDQVITDTYAAYNADCMEVVTEFPDNSIPLSVYSPPFGGLYHYSSDTRDMSNCADYQDFIDHYRFPIKELFRVTAKGRFTAVHCNDIPNGYQKGFKDLPGDILRLHLECGWVPWCRHFVWKEPLGVRLRTMAKGLAHKTIVDDASLCDAAAADHLILFRKPGKNEVPVSYPTGLTKYAGSRLPPSNVLPFRGYVGDQKKNIYSHWVWRQYASSFWDDVRIDRVLPYKEAREEEDEKHVHPLQLDVIERIIVLRSNPGEVVFSPYGGVGSEPYGALINGRKAIMAELKTSYYKQALLNLASAKVESDQYELNL